MAPRKEPITDRAQDKNLVEAYNLQSDGVTTFNLRQQLDDVATFENVTKRQSALSSGPWSFAPAITATLNDKIDMAGSPLGTILIIGQGMQTGRNGVFGDRTKAEIDAWRVKAPLVYKRATNTDIQRYRIVDRGEYILYPQPAAKLSDLPTGMRRHLESHKKELKKRAAYQRGDCEWWKFTWPLHEEYYGRLRMLCPYMATHNRFALDDTDAYLSLTDTTVLFENGQPESMAYLLALLNSKLLTFRFQTIGKLKSGGILEYFWNQVSRLPIRRIDFADAADKTRHDSLSRLSEQLVEAVGRQAHARTDSQREFYESRILSLEAATDSLVYELYGLTKEEQSAVERATLLGDNRAREEHRVPALPDGQAFGNVSRSPSGRARSLFEEE